MPTPPSPASSTVSWIEDDRPREALWLTAQGPAPLRIVTAHDTLSADTAYRMISQGTSLLWRGDFQNARQLLQALARRIDKKPAAGKKRKPAPSSAATPADAFNRHRQQQSQRTALLNRLLVELDANACVNLRRAPDIQEACRTALGDIGNAFLLPLRALQGLVGAHEWYRKGVAVPGLPGKIHVRYGVFSPNRGEYLALVAQAPLPSMDLAFDIGTGSGVLAAILAQRGVRKVVATDQDPVALACARENIDRLGYADTVALQQADLFPAGKSPLILCNPPWLPARPTTAIEHAIYDPGNRMLLGYLHGLRTHLRADGEGWLIMSDLAEHLGLRSRTFLAEAIAQAGLRIVEQHSTKPNHPKASDPADPLHHARQAETTSLWRLALKQP